MLNPWNLAITDRENLVDDILCIFVRLESDKTKVKVVFRRIEDESDSSIGRESIFILSKEGLPLWTENITLVGKDIFSQRFEENESIERIM